MSEIVDGHYPSRCCPYETIIVLTFSTRPPSIQWEPVPLTPEGQITLWVWFKPPHAPNSVALQIPVDFWQHPATCSRLTIRQLTVAVGIERLQGWTVFGQYYPWDGRTAEWLEIPLPPPAAGVEPSVILWELPASLPINHPSATIIPGLAGPANPTPGGTQPSGDVAMLLEQMEYHWNGILQIESDLRRVRMQLEQSVSRLSSLNRDLSSDEALAADNNDKKDWQDARRWLRDCAGGLSRSIKEIDVGLLSGAGQRNRFQDLVTQHIKPRIPFADMPQAAIDFEMFHKSARNVLIAAQSALSKGSADGERRANAVLRKIGAKIRARRSRRG